MPERLTARARAPAEALIVFGLALAVLWLCADRTGYEGDDINSIVPMLNLRESLSGALEIYRPAWQPLSYELGAIIYALSGSVTAVFVLAQLSIAAGIGILYLTTRHLGLAPLFFVPVLLLFPEILYSGLYFNSSALGFPLACVAVLLAFTGQSRASAAAIGGLLSLAILMRMDYVLIVPVVAAIRIWRQRDLAEVFIGAGAALAVFALAFVAGLLDPAAILETYASARDEIITKADTPGWDDYSKLMVATVVFSPTGLAFMLIALIWTVLTPRAWVPALIGLICLVPMIFAARNMLTPKYMLPAFALMPVIAALIWVDVSARLYRILYRGLAALWVGATVFFLVAALEPVGEAPYLRIALTDTKQIGTHDGARSWGGYLWQMARVPYTNADKDAATERLLDEVLAPREGAVAFVGPQNYFSPGGLAWRNLQLRLAQAGYRGQVIGKEALRFDLPAGPLFLLTSGSAAAHDLKAACVIDLSQREGQSAMLSTLRACRAS